MCISSSGQRKTSRLKKAAQRNAKGKRKKLILLLFKCPHTSQETPIGHLFSRRKQDEEEDEFGDHAQARSLTTERKRKIEHEMTHLPFRSWCRQCMEGRGREENCRKSIELERQVTEIRLDYMFMCDE